MTRSAAGSMRRLDDGPASKSGRWELRYRGRSRVHRGTRATAARALSLMVAIDSGRPPETGVALGEVVHARIDHIAPDRSPVTVGEYRRLTARHLDPYPVAQVPVDKLNAGHLEQHYSALKAAGQSAASIAPVHRLIVSALNQAWRWGWIEANPANRVQLTGHRPKRRKLPAVTTVLAVLDDLDEHNPTMTSLVRVAAGTGMRRGELCGLRWADVDLDAGLLQVHRSVVVANRQLVSKDTKTHEPRPVKIGADTVAVLAARWADAQAWAEECRVVLDLEVAHVWSDDPTGAVPWRPTRVSAAWRRAADRHGLADVRLHELRKLHVSLLRAAGVPLADVAARVGHADKRITEAIYEQALDTADTSGDLIDRLLTPGD